MENAPAVSETELTSEFFTDSVDAGRGVKASSLIIPETFFSCAAREKNETADSNNRTAALQQAISLILQVVFPNVPFHYTHN